MGSGVVVPVMAQTVEEESSSHTARSSQYNSTLHWSTPTLHSSSTFYSSSTFQALMYRMPQTLEWTFFGQWPALIDCQNIESFTAVQLLESSTAFSSLHLNQLIKSFPAVNY